MNRAHHLLRALVAVLAFALAAPAASLAATPKEFFGVMLDGPALAPSVDLDRETKLMGRSGVGSARLAMYWREMQPFEGVPVDWTEADRAVGSLARAGVRTFPTLVRAPAWATGGDQSEGAVPLDPATFATFAGEAVRRYGRGGTFWAENPTLPARPVRSWQVWNEPDIGRYWSGQPWPSTYVELLRAARPAIKSADPAAQVVAAGLTNRSWEDLGKLYKAGGRGLFDAAAIHPFSRRTSNVLKIVRLTRSTMKRNGDGRLPLVLTEVSWSSGKGQSTFNYGWEMTERGQARKVRAVLRALAGERRRLRIQALYWFTWLSPAEGQEESFSYAGLRKLRDGRPVAKPALHAFRRAVRKLR